ncbi:MAG TPA: Si-specific NAD(P)(+) transhydrogenase [Dehalococcoidia bacterium]|nr:Si-specific NAD(P)(+) transhydrogenase [Dehalococcoidia bacterium]
MHFDLLAIGSGPAGQKAALQASKLGKRAAVVERMDVLGGVSIHTGTIPSKTLREAVIYLTGYHQRTFYGHEYAVDDDITMEDLITRAQQVIQHQVQIATKHLQINGIEVLHGQGAFVDAHTIAVTEADGAGTRVTADFVLIATGSEAARPSEVPFDGARVLTSDDLLRLPAIPESLAVIGGGIIGTEYAGIFAALGIPVSLIDRRPRLLPFVDGEVADALASHFIENRVQLYLDEDVSDIDTSDPDAVQLHLESGKTVRAAAVLYAIGRVGITDGLHLEAAGLQTDERGCVPVNLHCQTAVSNIYAAGDVIGSPALAATSMEQGRLAACHAFDVPEQTASVPLPYAIYTVPEIAMLGPISEQLDEAGVEYVVGCAAYNEIARGRMLGDHAGFLKMLFHAPTGRLVGIHAVGVHASELIHIGQAVMAFGGRIDYFIDTVFNYPTLAECYKAAALDAANDLRRAGTYGNIDMFVPAPPVPRLEAKE